MADPQQSSVPDGWEVVTPSMPPPAAPAPSGAAGPANFSTSNDPVQAGLLAQALKLPTNQARAFLQMLGPRGKPALDAWEAQQPGIFGLGWDAVKTGASLLDPRPVMQMLDVVRGDPVASAQFGQGVYDASADQLRKAKAEYEKGHYSEAIGEGVGAVPVIGPVSAQMGEEGRRYFETGDPRAAARAIGGTAALVLGPRALEAGLEGSVAAVRGTRAALATRAATKAAAKLTAADTLFETELNAVAPSSKSYPYSSEDVQRARPFLRRQQAQTPVDRVESSVDVAQDTISALDDELRGPVKEYPHDLLRNKPLDAVRARLEESATPDTHIEAGLKALEPYNLDQPVTTTQAHKVLRRLNAERRTVLNQPGAKQSDVKLVNAQYEAMDAAAQALRQGMFDAFEARGVSWVPELRETQGSVIKIKNALENQHRLNAGDKEVPKTATGMKGLLGNVFTGAGGVLSSGAGYGIGSAVMGPWGAVAGSTMGAIGGAGLAREAANRLGYRSVGLTKDALIARAFGRLDAPGGALPTTQTIPPANAHLRMLGPGPGMLGPGPDPSFVRGVPAEPARPVRGQLGTGSTVELSAAPDASGSQTIRAAPIRWEREPGTGQMVPVQFSSDPGATPVPAPPLTMRGLLEPAPIILGEGEMGYTPGESGGGSVPAAPLGYEVIETLNEQGGKGTKIRPSQYSSEPGAKAAPQVEMSPAERFALYWIKDEMETLPAGQRTYLEDQLHRGGSYEVLPGHAGAKVYRDIVGPEGSQRIAAGREGVLIAIRNLFEGKLTKTGVEVLETARKLANADLKTAQKMMETSGPSWDAYQAFEESLKQAK